MVNVKMVNRSVLCLLCFALLLGCEKAEEPTAKVAIRAKAPAMVSQSEQTAQTSPFVAGDKMGIFAVRNGAVMSSVRNICITRSADGLWQSDVEIIYADSTREAQFYAYYPYSESVTFDPSAADPFAAWVASQSATLDQSTAEAFHAADIMTSGATSLTRQASLDFAFAHRRTMVRVEMPTQTYVFTNDLPPYTQWAPTDVQFKVAEQTIQPFWNADQLCYQYLMQPASFNQIELTYTNTLSQTKHATIPSVASIPAGQFAHFTIDGGKQERTMTLHVGDFFLKDGSIVSKEDNPDAADVLGVVCQLGTTDAIRADYPNCSHGIVLALTESKAKWSTHGSTTSDENAAGWKTWWTEYGLSDLPTTKAAEINQSALTPVGYEFTKAWLAVPSDLTLGGYTVPVKDGFQLYYDNYVASHPLPNMTTNWFVPSLREWLTIKAAETELAASFTQVSAAPFAWTGSSSAVYYWSSNLRAATSMWTFTGKDSDASADLFHADTKDSRIYRLIFAF